LKSVYNLNIGYLFSVYKLFLLIISYILFYLCVQNLGGFNKEPQEAADSEGEGDEEADAAETGKYL